MRLGQFYMVNVSDVGGLLSYESWSVTDPTIFNGRRDGFFRIFGGASGVESFSLV